MPKWNHTKIMVHSSRTLVAKVSSEEIFVMVRACSLSSQGSNGFSCSWDDTWPERWAERKLQVQPISGHCEALLVFVRTLEPQLFLCQPEEDMETCSFHTSLHAMVRHTEPSLSSIFWEPGSIRRVRGTLMDRSSSSFISLLSWSLARDMWRAGRSLQPSAPPQIPKKQCDVCPTFQTPKLLPLLMEDSFLLNRKLPVETLLHVLHGSRAACCTWCLNKQRGKSYKQIKTKCTNLLHALHEVLSASFSVNQRWMLCNSNFPPQI